MSEGSLDAPIRHPLDWRNEVFYDEEDLDRELRRVFDICHGCRRCFNLCDSFPRLFDMIDETEEGEVEGLKSEQFQSVVDACTLCDMCYMTKCPYVPPHEFNLDFPHLMLRARAIENRHGRTSVMVNQLTRTDRNGRLGCSMHGLANWATKRGNGLTRPLMEFVAGVHKEAELPRFAAKPFEDEVGETPPAINAEAPARGRKAVVFATCFANFNATDIGMSAVGVLAHNGVETEVVYPGCCGMPQLERGDIAAVAESAKKTSAILRPYVEAGHAVVALVPSCALMMKFEWPLILPDNEDVKILSGAMNDITEYLVDIAKNEGLADGLRPLDGDVTVHVACHARAQNMGRKGAEMLRLIPETKINVIERCSGHGGSWGVMRETFEVGMKVGAPVFRQASGNADKYLVSECPLARDHILQGIERLNEAATPVEANRHPIELIAKAYGL